MLGTERNGYPMGVAIGVGELAGGVDPATGVSLQPVELEPLVPDRVLDA